VGSRVDFKGGKEADREIRKGEFCSVDSERLLKGSGEIQDKLKISRFPKQRLEGQNSTTLKGI